MTHNFLTFDYTTVNAGDFIQTIATEYALGKVFDGHQVDIRRVFRNRLLHADKHYVEGRSCIMQGWFEHGSLGFYPPEYVSATWVGTHFNRSARSQLEAAWHEGRLPRPSEVGCRDLQTLKFCRRLSIPSYFSRCLTLTLPSRTSVHPAAAKTFIVNVNPAACEMIPDSVSKNAITINQRWCGGGFQRASQLLDMYRKEAGLVITSAIHCAAPCVAMGVPVVFIEPDDEPSRISMLRGILPMYTVSDVSAKTVDFSPTAPDITRLKTLLLTNLELSLNQKNLYESDLLRLQVIRGEIAQFTSPGIVNKGV